ncbi:23617_t:CDS:2 [Dentiscutata erythropus]|uniref:23617_t:CDS:1 n=1 Tax=Dentiscutata erythropus TaxID=1348616 RepID=A0A9N9DN11_9GLOM|nr:23617_t:CDS:2 [Dentiscutata erythropus]
MFLNVKSVFIILFLISLTHTFCGVDTIAIPNSEGLIRRDDASSAIQKVCGGFSFVNPPANGSSTTETTIKNGTTTTCNWSVQSGSQVDYVIDFELFMDSGDHAGLIAILWNKGAKMTQNSASADVLIYCPSDSGITLPATFLARSFANTTSGPQCTAYTYAFLSFILSN